MKAIAMFLSLLPIAGIAQEDILGLLEIPVLHSVVNSGVANADRALGTVTLYSEPNVNSEVVAVVGDRRELESREHGYEQVSAVVFARAGNGRSGYYYQLQTTGDEPRSGWVWQGDAGQFRSSVTLIASHGLTYLTSAWDGRLFESPMSDSPSKLFPNREAYQDVRVVGSQNRGGFGAETWYLVVLVRGSCTAEPLEIVDFGWVPEYSESGGNTVWFYSRGC
jgi:hypothetical protein